jgi:ribosomal protein S7
MRRALWETLTDAVTSVTPQETETVRVTSVFFDLPIEVTLRRQDTEMEFLADLPRWRLRTDFDEPKGRLQILATEAETP